MARDLTAAVATATEATVVRPVLLAELHFADGIVRLWSGIGDLEWDGKVFAGVGTLGGVSPVSESADIVATGIRFALSGIPSELLATALGQARQGKQAVLWLALLDEDNDVIEDPYRLFDGLLDVPEIGEGAETSIITITAESELAILRRAAERRYTHEDQQIDHPGDLGFEYVASLQDKEIIWGGGPAAPPQVHTPTVSAPPPGFTEVFGEGGTATGLFTPTPTGDFFQQAQEGDSPGE